MCIRDRYHSTAELAIVQMQDILELGNEARMNYPSTVGHNSVSYTHLDVYKRQLQSVRARWLPNTVCQTISALSAMPVSYTHLDVYKRQRLR